MDQVTPDSDEATLLQKMKAHADRWGLWADVERSYNQHKASHKPETAAFYAFYDWDILDYRNGYLCMPWDDAA